MAIEADVARVVRSSVTVKLPRDAAFRLFTERMGSWWPLATHSVFHAEAVAVTIEPVVGGRVYEATADGRTSDWGTITEWQPWERCGASLPEMPVMGPRFIRRTYISGVHQTFAGGLPARLCPDRKGA